MRQKLIVLGGGESGTGAALLGKEKGYDVLVSDSGGIAEKYRKVLLKNNIRFEEGGHREALGAKADLVVKSPGIPGDVPVVKTIREKGVPVVSEIEFAARYTDACIVGITGSNGKTTTAVLLHHILKNAGLDVALAGNVGQSFAAQVAGGHSEYYVLEVSSFQLDDIVGFRPHIAVLTNITPDHLNRYGGSFEAYAEAKFNLLQNQTTADYFIYDADDEIIAEWLEKKEIQAVKKPFTIQKTTENKDIMPTETLALQGMHNRKNAMAASTAAGLLNIRKATIRESLETFQGVEHRLEIVSKVQDITYINDSKATNVNAAFYALESMHRPTVWIAGGEDKGNDYEKLLPLVNEKVKAIVCLGIDNSKLIETFSGIVQEIVEVRSMAEAVLIARDLAESGDTVLLAPACASFDLFENFEDRGRQFKETVKKL